MDTYIFVESFDVLRDNVCSGSSTYIHSTYNVLQLMFHTYFSHPFLELFSECIRLFSFPFDVCVEMKNDEKVSHVFEL